MTRRTARCAMPSIRSSLSRAARACSTARVRVRRAGHRSGAPPERCPRDEHRSGVVGRAPKCWAPLRRCSGAAPLGLTKPTLTVAVTLTLTLTVTVTVTVTVTLTLSLSLSLALALTLTLTLTLTCAR